MLAGKPFRVLLLLGLLGAAAADLRAQQPPFSVAPTSLSFGDVVVGIPKTLTIRVTPVVGYATVVFNIASTNPAFSVSPTQFSTVQPFNVSVTFTPPSLGTFSGQVNISGDGIVIGLSTGPVLAPVTVSVPASGNGVPSFSVSPKSLSFGNVPLGVSVSQTFVVTPTLFSFFTVSSTSPSFTVSPASFSGSQSVTITVTFNPKSLGTANGQILVTGDALAGPGLSREPASIQLSQPPVPIPATVAVPVTGNGIPLFSLSPTTIDFGEVVLNTPSSRSFTVSPNISASFTVASTNPAYTVIPSSFNGSSPQTVTVTFVPTAVGPFSPFSGQIQVTGQTPGSTPSTLSVAVTGLGTTPFGISTNSLNFGGVLVGTTSSLTFTVNPRILTAFTVASTNPVFSVNQPAFVSAAQQVITVTFAPMTTGPVNAQITVTGDPVTGFAALASGPGPVHVPTTLRLTVSGSGVTAFSMSPTSLDFGGVLLSCSALMTFTVTPAADLSFALSSDNAAFVPNPATFSGASPQPVNVTFTPSAAGDASGAINIAASRGGQPVDSDKLPVTGLGADLDVSPSSLDFGGVAVGSTSHRTVTYSTSPSISANFVVNSSNTNPAFNATPSSQPGQIDIAFAPRAEGALTDTITLTFTLRDAGYSCSLTRKIAVSGSGVPAGTISVLPAALEFAGKVGVPLQEQRFVTITSPQLADLRWSAEVNGGTPGWLRFSPARGSVPGALIVEVDTTGLGQGVQQTQMLITPRTPDGTPQSGGTQISVRLTMSQEGPRLVVAPPVLSFAGAEGSTVRHRRAVVIVNGGGSSLNWTAQTETVDGRRWLSIDPASGAAPSAATAIADITGLAAGVYQGRIRFRAGGQEVIVPVTLLVSRPGPLLATDRAGVLFEAIEGSQQLPPQQFHVLNTGTGVANWTADLPTLPSWLTLSPSSGASNAGDLRGAGVTLTANATGLGAGIYSALVRLQSASALNSPQFVTAVLNVLRAGSPPPLDLDPGGILFVAARGGPAPAARSIEVRIGSPQPVTFRAAPTTFNGADWLNVTPASASASTARSATIQVSANIAGLVPAVYRGQIGVELPDGTMRSTAVTLVVTPSATATLSTVPAVLAGTADQAACAPAQLVVTPTVLAGNFTARAGWPVLMDVLVSDNCGTAVDTAAVLTTFSNGDAPLNMAPQGAGVYRGTWISRQSASQVNVTTIALAPPLAQGQAVVVGGVSQNVFPAIFKNGIVNGASFAPGAPLAPGGIVSLFGSNFGAGTFLATATPLPAVLGDVRVAVGGRATPLFFASPGQINAQLPFEVAPAIQPQVVVQAAGQYTVPEMITTVNAEPGIFILVASVAGPDRAVAQNLDFTLNTPANPADRGSAVILYLTGQGSVSPAVATGATAPSTAPFATATETAEVTIQERKADVLFLGLTPGFVGLLQAVVRVPADTTPGSAVPVSFTIAGQPSNTLNISVK